MTSTPTLDDLRAELAEAEAAYHDCLYIDDWGSVQKCRAECQRAIERLRKEISERDEGWSGIWK